jgi:hypothetical protein
MGANNAVYLSYQRRARKYLALAVYQDLRETGIDSFLDVGNGDDRQFDAIKLDQIARRLWSLILEQNGRFRDVDWVDKTLSWGFTACRGSRKTDWGTINVHINQCRRSPEAR